MSHREIHRFDRIAWLRAAVLGANDGILSTASLILGVAAAGASSHSIFIAGIAALVAGAMSMAAGEYISVSSQADTENADLDRERAELATDIEHEYQELADIYVSRGLDPILARQVSEQLMAHDALAAHARDELGIMEIQRARPVLAAFSSAISFSMGSGLPLFVVIFTPANYLTPTIIGTSLFFLAALGWLAAYVGGAKPLIGISRVTFWGAAAMSFTYAIGALFGTVA